MMNKNDEEQIKIHLKNMPKVEDRITEEEWIERVQPNTYKRKRVQKKHSMMIPILSTALLIGIMFLILPSIIQGPSTSTNQESMSMNTEMDKELLPDNNRDEFGRDRIMGEDIGVNKDGKFVVFELKDDETLVYGGTFDQQVQYTIPLALITSNDQSLSDAYTELHTYLTTLDNNPAVPYFKDVSFEIDEESRSVLMEVPDDYSVGEGSAVQGKFEEMLSIIFYPYGIEEVIIKNKEGSSVSLGEIGKVPSIEVKKPLAANYKYYYNDVNEQALLVPIPQEDHSFTEAILDLQVKDEQFSIQETIPQEVELKITCERERECTVSFKKHAEDLSEEDVVLAVESILMTAKSYGYTHISFDGLSAVTAPGYDFSESVEVPLAVNPVQINE